jgi:flagellar motor switch/type III secretory pathway protein FliN
MERRIRIGDPVDVVVDGITVAHGHLVSEHGRLCVRVATMVTASDSQEKDR